MAIGALQPSQIWARLERHAAEVIAPLRLQELCRATDRVAALVSVHTGDQGTMLVCDLSRQRWTLETLQLLLTLAATRRVSQFIQQMAWGQNNPNDPVVPREEEEQQEEEAHLQTEKKGKSKPTTTTTNKNNNNPPHKATRFQSSRPTAVTIDTSQMPTSPPRPAAHEPPAPHVSMHMALRVPPMSPRADNNNNNKASNKTTPNTMYTADGRDALAPIHHQWERIRALATAVRNGQRRGATGAALKTIVVVGRGVPMAALQWVHQAWQQVYTTNAPAETRLRRMAAPLLPSDARPSLHLLTTTEAAVRLIPNLDAASTLVVSWALRGNEETGVATLKQWLLQALVGGRQAADVILSKHLILVTGNAHVASLINKPDAVLQVPPHTATCEPFTTFTAVTLLPLALVYGWDRVAAFLAGAHDMDRHVVDAHPRHNVPLLLALSDVWNDIFLKAPARVVVPSTQAWGLYPTYCGALETQVCGNTATRSAGRPGTTENFSCASLVLDGGLDSLYDRALYQSARVCNVELVTALDAPVPVGAESLLESVQAVQDAQMASFFAHADELAFGYDRILSDPVLPSPMSVASVQTVAPEPQVSRGNRPSTLLICDKLDAFACGQLIALAEHRAAIKAHIWGMDPFAAGMDLGASLRMQRTDHLKDDLETLLTTVGDEDTDDEEVDGEDSGVVQNHNMNLSTRTILKHYARTMREKRGSRSSC